MGRAGDGIPAFLESVVGGRWADHVPGWSRYERFDACVMHFSAGDTSIRSLGAPLNTTGWDGDFFIARDESYIIMSANETKDFECELHISFRKPDGGWTAPMSLGPLINDGMAHRWGEYVTPDGRYLFYTRATSPKDCHLYWVRFDGLLERMRAGLVTR